MKVMGAEVNVWGFKHSYRKPLSIREEQTPREGLNDNFGKQITYIERLFPAKTACETFLSRTLHTHNPSLCLSPALRAAPRGYSQNPLYFARTSPGLFFTTPRVVRNSPGLVEAESKGFVLHSPFTAYPPTLRLFPPLTQLSPPHPAHFHPPFCPRNATLPVQKAFINLNIP